MSSSTGASVVPISSAPGNSMADDVATVSVGVVSVVPERNVLGSSAAIGMTEPSSVSASVVLNGSCLGGSTANGVAMSSDGSASVALESNVLSSSAANDMTELRSVSASVVLDGSCLGGSTANWGAVSSDGSASVALESNVLGSSAAIGMAKPSSVGASVMPANRALGSSRADGMAMGSADSASLALESSLLGSSAAICMAKSSSVGSSVVPASSALSGDGMLGGGALEDATSIGLGGGGSACEGFDTLSVGGEGTPSGGALEDSAAIGIVHDSKVLNSSCLSSSSANGVLDGSVLGSSSTASGMASGSVGIASVAPESSVLGRRAFNGMAMGTVGSASVTLESSVLGSSSAAIGMAKPSSVSTSVVIDSSCLGNSTANGMASSSVDSASVTLESSVLGSSSAAIGMAEPSSVSASVGLDSGCHCSSRASGMVMCSGRSAGEAPESSGHSRSMTSNGMAKSISVVGISGDGLLSSGALEDTTSLGLNGGGSARDDSCPIGISSDGVDAGEGLDSGAHGSSRADGLVTCSASVGPESSRAANDMAEPSSVGDSSGLNSRAADGMSMSDIGTIMASSLLGSSTADGVAMGSVGSTSAALESSLRGSGAADGKARSSSIGASVVPANSALSSSTVDGGATGGVVSSSSDGTALDGWTNATDVSAQVNAASDVSTALNREGDDGSPAGPQWPNGAAPMTGELLFAILQPQWPNLAPKLVGMLLELNSGELQDVLASEIFRRARVYEALAVLSLEGGSQASSQAMQYLMELPVLTGKPGARVIDAFLMGKDYELRSPAQRVMEGNRRIQLRSLATGSHLIFSEPSADGTAERRLLLRIRASHMDYGNRGQAVAALRERVVPEVLACEFACDSPRYSEVFHPVWLVRDGTRHRNSSVCGGLAPAQDASDTSGTHPPRSLQRVAAKE